jgi:hypothetical protein
LCGRTKCRRRPKRESEDEAIGRSRGGLSPKISIAVDGFGNPVRFILIPASQIKDSLFVCDRRRSYCMSLWWLAYNRHGRLHSVVVVEAASLISACVGVGDNALDKGVSFVEGHELDAERARRIPPGYVGMVLSRKEAEQLLDRIERGAGKRR